MHPSTQLALTALLSIHLLAPLAHASRGDPLVAHQGQAVDQLIAEFMKEHQIPGMALAIVQAPYITRVSGYGLADPTPKTLVGTATVFPLGQMLNGFTAVALLQQVEAGNLSLDAPAKTYLPRLPGNLGTLLVRDILRQSTGLPDLPAKAKSPEAALTHVARARTRFEPGQRIIPSSTNQLLARMLIAAAASKPFPDIIREGQIERLALTQTFFRADLPPTENLADGHLHRLFLTDPRRINPIEPAVGPRSPVNPDPWEPELLSSAHDISLWDIGLAGDILIRSPELRALLYTPSDLPAETSGRSSGVWTFPGRPGLMTLTGSASGCSSFLSRYTAPEELLCVTLLANRPNLPLAPLAARIAAAFDARLIQTVPPERGSPSGQTRPHPPQHHLSQSGPR
ncbi:MAG: serine hydrolase domain-containing protein [Verrucomicrobiia bacterium]